MGQLIQDLKDKVAQLEAEAVKLAQDASSEAQKLAGDVRTEVQALIARLEAVLSSL